MAEVEKVLRMKRNPLFFEKKIFVVNFANTELECGVIFLVFLWILLN